MNWPSILVLCFLTGIAIGLIIVRVKQLPCICSTCGHYKHGDQRCGHMVESGEFDNYFVPCDCPQRFVR